MTTVVLRYIVSYQPGVDLHTFVTPCDVQLQKWGNLAKWAGLPLPKLHASPSLSKTKHPDRLQLCIN